LYLSFENSEKVLESIPQEEGLSYISWDKMRTDPSFPGGNKAMRKFIDERIVYPNEAIDKEITGTVFVKFLVSATGSITDVQIQRSVSPILDAEAMRVIRSMPKWIPGKNMNDQPVICEMYLPVRFMIPGVKTKNVNTRDYQSDDIEFTSSSPSDTIDEKSDGSRHILPSSVLAFWNTKFNNTILATREFEERMKEIHKTCDPSVLDIYVKNLNMPLCALDEKVAAKGYSRFRHFADEQVGAIELKNPHLTALSAFYDKAIEALKRQEKGLRDRENKKRKKWDQQVNNEREKEITRSAKRDEKVLEEEYNLNLRNVGKQLGRVLGATIHGGGTICNIDRYVMETTLARKSNTIIDPETGKTAKIQYNDFGFTIANHEDYSQLYAYVFPRQLNSYHRIDGEEGSFNFPLNDAMEYDLVVVGISENGYSYLQSESLKGGDLGALELESISEKHLDARIRQMNSKRGIKAFDVKQELKWLKTEQQNYVERRRRSDDRKFRNQLRPKVFPCDCEIGSKQ
jgi:TonB family protein